MTSVLLCSDCFLDEGLRRDAQRIGSSQDGDCPRCGSADGRKLDQEALLFLSHEFFVRGSFQRSEYGGAPVIQFNEHQKTDIDVTDWLGSDVRALSDATGMGFFYYGPPLWALGSVVPLEQLQSVEQGEGVVNRILTEYPSLALSEGAKLYRLRIAPGDPSRVDEYDSPPNNLRGRGRLDSPELPVLYTSQDLELCVHECRVSVEDEVFVATLRTNRPLRLLDLTAVLDEDINSFESLDLAVHMLFLAGPHSYDIGRRIATAARSEGFDGIVYPSYFSLVRTGAMPFATAYGLPIRRFPSQRARAAEQVVPNVALFGFPIADGTVRVACINRVLLRQVSYGLSFGPLV